jgi:hypothetical protein
LPLPSETPSAPEVAPTRWRFHIGLFVVTLASVFGTQAVFMQEDGDAHFAWKRALQFTAALMGVLFVHEMSHFVAARIHRVHASPPYFIPMPFVSPFGTMGAVIRMRGSIPTRKALLDIGASGPLGGLAVAIPLYAWGVTHSHFVPLTDDLGQLGESILMRTLDHFFAPTPPAGMDLLLHPVAYGAWAGMLVTMINLLPVSQLDGGHVAYALFGPKQDKLALNVHRAVLVFFFVSLVGYIVRDLRIGYGFTRLEHSVGNSMWWLVWFEVLAILGTMASRGQDHVAPTEEPGAITTRTRIVSIIGLVVLASLGRAYGKPIVWIAWFVNVGILLAMEVRGGALRKHHLMDHPHTGAAPLDGVRKGVAIFTLAMFVLLFMPTPFEV